MDENDKLKAGRAKGHIEMSAESARKQRDAYDRQRVGASYVRRGFLGESERFLESLIWWNHG